MFGMVGTSKVVVDNTRLAKLGCCCCGSKSCLEAKCDKLAG